ncbi:DNA helicase MCM9 [Helicoverpa armigera]|uniref:DNA helicase MCM9 n=1 Tax=Helicoverpa armigera TaxID=29058 RepID=UPI003082D2DC
MILDYVIKFHLEDCINILSEQDNLGYYSIKIDFLKLFETYPDVGDKVLCSPVETLPACDKDLIKAQQTILEQEEYKLTISKLDYCFLKRNIHARFFGLPVCPELHRTVFPKNLDLGCFLKVTGTVVRVTQSKMLEYQRKYVCVKCKFENCVEAEFENRYILKAPSKCGNDVKACRSNTFTQVPLVSREHCKDYQEIKIQEQVNKLSIGTIPGSMWVVLEDDLVDCCKPGDDVLICATVRRRWRPSGHNKKSEVELVLQANFVEVCNAQRSEVISTAPDIKDCFDEFWSKYDSCPMKGRDRILGSVCPQVYGLHLVKLAVLLTVITGSNHVAENDGKKNAQDEKHATRVRGQCHLLLVGDPGTGKSQLLRTSAELTARSVFTSGAGSTRAGLTCAALREDGEWQLEAGALVLSDGGVCCIDEISQLREHDRTAIHEAMEQQTISVAKAGIVCKLNTRCAIIAACNPKGHYDTDQHLSVNVSLGTPLLSRFDLIFILLDSKNKTWDRLVSSYILFGDSNPTECKKKWNLEKLQMYISLVGPKYTEMTQSANIIMQKYYMAQRKSEHRDPSRTTVRMLDSLVRLSQAHCRLMYRKTILPMDAVVAVSLIDLSMQDCTLDDTVDALHSTIPKYPDYEYLCTAKKLLTRLNLVDVWRNELLYYAKLMQVDHKTLESDIEAGNCKLFANHDDVTDDNIQLSASQITSSYFNNKKSKKNNDTEKENNEENLRKENGFKDDGINEKLAVTLKKHKTLNKAEKEPPIVKKKGGNKRKRKEVTLDITGVKNQLSKRVKKTKGNQNHKEEEDLSNSDEDNIEDRTILNAVPSVNDALADLGIDFNFENDSNETNTQKDIVKTEPKEFELTSKGMFDTSIDNNDSVLGISVGGECSKSKEIAKVTDVEEGTVSKLKRFQFVDKKPKDIKTKSKSMLGTSVENDNSILDISVTDDTTKNKDEKRTDVKERTVGKLKQFQFVSKHDLDKYDDKPGNLLDKTSNNEENKIPKLKENKENISNNKPSTSKSQISIFEDSELDVENCLDDSTNVTTIAQVNSKENSSNSSYKKLSNPSSQISMFETSDCDIDLDI